MWQRMEKFYFIQQIYRMMRELPLHSLRKMEDTKPWKRLLKDLQIESKPRSRDYFCGYQSVKTRQCIPSSIVVETSKAIGLECVLEDYVRVAVIYTRKRSETL